MHGVKWYPAGVATKAEHGVRKITRYYATLKALEVQRLRVAATVDVDGDVVKQRTRFRGTHRSCGGAGLAKQRSDAGINR